MELSSPLSCGSAPDYHAHALPPSHPYPIGSKTFSRLRGEVTFRPAEIRGHRVLQDEHQYYVHYTDLDKRMDEWVDLDRLDLTRVSIAEEADAAGLKGKGRKVKKRKGEPGVSPTTSPLASPTFATVPVPPMATPTTTTTATPTTPNKDPKANTKGTGKSGPSGSAAPAQEVDPHDDPRKPKNVKSLYIGKYVIEPWYFSPYHFSVERFPNPLETEIDLDADPPPPMDTSIAYGYDEQSSVQIDLFLCEFCLKPFDNEPQLNERHMPKCRARHPPGDEIYRDSSRKLSIFEVEGKRQRGYCQNVCLLSKLFLEHKWLKYCVDPFVFYVVTEWDELGHHFMGYFSKEKDSPSGYNLACIMTLPPYQNRGIGRLLIEFSYELSKKEKKVGTPEKPLSDLGQRSYFSYWRDTLLMALLEADKRCENCTIQDLSQVTSITPEDVTETLTKLGIISKTKKTPYLSLSDYPKSLAYQIAVMYSRITHIDPLKLHWTPIRPMCPVT